MPNLSPVGSLTNLLTDLSSTGFRRSSSNQGMTEDQLNTIDKNMEIPLILAKQVASKKHRQLSIPPVLFQAKKEMSNSLRFLLNQGAVRGTLNRDSANRRHYLSQDEKKGIHMFSPQVEESI